MGNVPYYGIDNYLAFGGIRFMQYVVIQKEEVINLNIKTPPTSKSSGEFLVVPAGIEPTTAP